MRVKVFRSVAYDAFEIYITEERHNKSYLVEPIEFNLKEHNPNEVFPIPTIRLKSNVAEEIFTSLANELTLLGYMKKTDVSDELKATKYHLEDFRKLIFNGKKKD